MVFLCFINMINYATSKLYVYFDLILQNFTLIFKNFLHEINGSENLNGKCRSHITSAIRIILNY